MKKIWLRMQTLPDYGDHPGTLFTVFLLVMAALVGSCVGLRGALSGVSIVALTMGPIYLWGAWDRGNLYLRKCVRLLATYEVCFPRQPLHKNQRPGKPGR